MDASGCRRAGAAASRPDFLARRRRRRRRVRALGAHVEALLDRAGAERAAVVGVSFGGLIAARFAARYRDRVAALVLVSTPAPRWQLDPQTAEHVRRPRCCRCRCFAARRQRGAGELVAALPTLGARSVRAAHPRGPARAGSPSRMAGGCASGATDIAADCAQGAPTLVLTGEPRLDRVVPVSSSLEYIELIPARGISCCRRPGTSASSQTAEFASLLTERRR